MPSLSAMLSLAVSYYHKTKSISTNGGIKVKLKKTDVSGFDKIYGLMERAFPYDERRDREKQKECFMNECFSAFEIEKDGEFSGFLTAWEFENFVFFEHLAVLPEKRNGGIGSLAVEEAKKYYSGKPIVLEVEKPLSDITKRRVAFYERHGFKNNGVFYEQPSYHNESPLVLDLMSFPAKLSEEGLCDFLSNTRKTVYNVK